MNKSEFVSRVAKNTGVTTAESQRLVQAVLDEISDALKAGEDVAFAGFGKFTVSQRAARTGAARREVTDPAGRVARGRGSSDQAPFSVPARPASVRDPADAGSFDAQKHAHTPRNRARGAPQRQSALRRSLLTSRMVLRAA